MTEQQEDWFDDLEIQSTSIEDLPYQIPSDNNWRGSFHFFPAKYRTENGDQHDCWVEKESLSIGDEAEKVGILRRSKREICILRSLSNNHHVYQFIDIFQTEHSVHRIYEKQLPSYRIEYYCSEKVLNSFTQNEEAVRSIMYQLLIALNQCHSKKIVHGQIQPRSMLVIPTKDEKSGEATYHLKLTNFDRARIFYAKDPFPCNYHKCSSTLWFAAPEILLSEESLRDFLEGGETDMWAVGVTLAHISVNNHPLFPGKSEIETIFKIFRQLGTPHITKTWLQASKLPYYNKAFPKWNAIAFPKNIMDQPREEGCNLLQKLLSLNPQKRPTVKECVKHAYFKDMAMIHQGLERSH